MYEPIHKGRSIYQFALQSQLLVTQQLNTRALNMSLSFPEGPLGACVTLKNPLKFNVKVGFGGIFVKHDQGWCHDIIFQGYNNEYI